MFEICDDLLRPVSGDLDPTKIYLGGDAEKVEAHLGLSGDDICMWATVYGDVIVSKSRFKWRTYVVLQVEQDSSPLKTILQTQINELMKAKEDLENEGNDLRLLGLQKRRRTKPCPA